MVPDPSGELAEPIVYITSTRVDLYCHQILLGTPKKGHQGDMPYCENVLPSGRTTQ